MDALRAAWAAEGGGCEVPHLLTCEKNGQGVARNGKASRAVKDPLNSFNGPREFFHQAYSVLPTVHSVLNTVYLGTFSGRCGRVP